MAIALSAKTTANSVNSLVVTDSIAALCDKNSQIPAAKAWEDLAKQTGILFDSNEKGLPFLHVAAAKLANFRSESACTLEKIRPLIEAALPAQIKEDLKGSILKVLIALAMPNGSDEIENLALKKLETLRADGVEVIKIDSATQYRLQKITDRATVNTILAGFTFVPYSEVHEPLKENPPTAEELRVKAAEEAETRIITRDDVNNAQRHDASSQPDTISNGANKIEIFIREDRAPVANSMTRNKIWQRLVKRLGP